MAVVYPAANDNWSTVANWMSGGNPYGQLPQSGDIVCANGKTVTIDMDLAAYTFDRLTTAATAPAAAGGGFTMGIGGTINANITAGTTPCLTSTGIGTTLAINGEIKGGGSTNARGLTCSGGCTVTITGNVTGGSGGTNAYGIGCNAACTVTITGNVTGGSQTSAYGIGCNAACNVTITGNVTGGSNTTAYGIGCNAACTVTITGNVTGGSYNNAYGIYCTAACNVTITGNVTGGSGSGAYGIYCTAANNIITISGTILGKTAVGVYLTNATTGSSITATGVIGDGTGVTAVQIDSNSTLNIIATVVASVNGYGIYAPSSTLTYRGILTNYASRMAVVVAHMILTANTDTIWTFYDTASNYVVMASNATDISQPAQKDVRLNTVYGLASQFIGSLAVPPPAAVAFAVPTDNTTGTMQITPPDIQAACESALTAYGAAKTTDLSSIDIQTGLTTYGAAKTSDLAGIDIGAGLTAYGAAKTTDIINELKTSPEDVAERIRNLATVEAVGDIHAT
jgi:hypothetical protein